MGLLSLGSEQKSPAKSKRSHSERVALAPDLAAEQDPMKAILHLPPHQGAANTGIFISHFSSKTVLNSLQEKEFKHVPLNAGQVTACISGNRAKGATDGEVPD